MKYTSLLLTICIALAVGFAGCESTGSNGGTGTMQISMTDAPANYDSVNVTINKIRVNKSEDAGADSSESDEDAEANGWVTITDQQQTINLLELTNGNQIMLGAKEIEAGSYAQLRLILGAENTVTVDGTTYELKTPSAQQSGLKLNVNAEVEEDVTYNLLLDFDAARSIVKRGNGGYLLKPVIHAVSLAETGSVAGTVQPTDFKTNVMAVVNDDTVSSTITADDGNFQILGLAPNSDYKVVFDPDSNQYADSTQTGIEVSEGEENEIGTIELEQTSSI